MNSSGKIVNLVTPTNAQDAATKSYVDSSLTNALGSSGTQENRPTVQRGDTTNEFNYLTFINNADIASDGSNKRALMRCDSNLYYNPSSNTLYATNFSGSATSAEYATRASSNKFTINGGPSYSNDIPADTMLYIKDQGGGYGAMIRLTSYGGHHFVIGQTYNAPDCFLWNQNNGYIRFGTSNTERMIIKADGKVGIGTSEPGYTLHVNGTGVMTSTTGGYLDLGGASKAGTDNRPVVAGFVGGWVAGNTGFILFSDQRIKSNIINVDIQSNLELFRKIRPVKHGYIDKLEYGNFNKYGFIAQDIQQLLPEAVVEGTQVIPSVYCNANIVNTQNNFLLRLEIPLKDIQQFSIGTKLKCYDEKNEIVWVTIKDIIDTQNIEIEEDITNDKLFVYGHSVDDFLQIEKDTIWTVATAALQEVDRQQQADKARIAELEAKVSEQQSLINDILERLKALEKA